MRADFFVDDRLRNDSNKHIEATITDLSELKKINDDIAKLLKEKNGKVMLVISAQLLLR